MTSRSPRLRRSAASFLCVFALLLPPALASAVPVGEWVDPPATVPPIAFQQAQVALDAARDRALVYDPQSRTMWWLALATGAWGTAPSSGLDDQATQRLLLNDSTDGSILLVENRPVWPFFEVRTYRLESGANAWAPVPRGTLGPLRVGSLTVDTNRQRVLASGQVGSVSAWQLFELPLAGSGTWSVVPRSPAIGAWSQRFMSLTYDPIGDRVLLIDNAPASSVGLGVRSVRLGAPETVNVVVPGGAFSAPYQATGLVVDAAHERLLAIGGEERDVNGEVGVRVQCAVLELPNGSFWRAGPTDGLPELRYPAVSVDPHRPRVVAIGGGSERRVLQLDLGTLGWQNSLDGSPAPLPPPRQSWAAVHELPGAPGMIMAFGTRPLDVVVHCGPSYATYPSESPGPAAHAATVGKNRLEWSAPFAGENPPSAPALAGDPARGELLAFGGYRGTAFSCLDPPDVRPFGRALIDATLRCLHADGTQLVTDSIAVSGSRPPARAGAALARDAALDAFYLVGGTAQRPGGADAVYVGELWKLDRSRTPAAWTEIPTTGAPASIGSPFAVVDEHTGRLVVFDPRGAGLWDVSPRTGTWSSIATSGPAPPAGAERRACTWDPFDRRILVFAGGSVYAYPLAVGGRWERLELGGTAPADTVPGPAFGYDSENDVFVLVDDEAHLLRFDRPGTVGAGAPRHGVGLAIARVSPNPLRSRTPVVSFVLAGHEPAAFDVYDLAGRRVHHEPVPAPRAGAQTLRLALPSALAPGLYQVVLTQARAASRARIAVLR